MADIKQLEQALINADKAGDMDAARKLAGAIRQAREVAPVAEPETTAKGVAGAVTRGLALPAAGAMAGGAAGALLGGVGAVPGAIVGAGAASLAGLVGDPVVNAVNKLFGSQFATPTEAIEGLLTKAGVAQPQTSTEKIAQAVASGAGGAGGMAAAGKAVQMAASGPVTKEVGRMMASQPVAQVLGGAGAGGAGQAVREGGGGTAAEIAASLAGGVAGGMAGATRAARVRPTVNPAVAEAERLGVPVLTSDVRQPETFIGKAAQKMGERVPLAGTGPLRVEQQKARVDSVRDLLRDFGGDDANLTDNIMKDLSKTRSTERTKYVQAKREVIDRLDNAGEVPIPNTLKKIDEIVARLKKENTESSLEAAARLEQIGGAGTSGASNRTLAQLEAFRRDDLANAFKDDPTRPLSVAARDVGEKALREIYAPVRQDMGAFIKQSGERRDYEKWMVSNKRLEGLAGELKMNTLKSVLKSGDATPEVVNKMLFSKKPSEVNQLYASLSPAGRANARTSIISQAAQKAEFEAADGVKMYSPEKFNAEIKRLQPQIGTFFKGEDLERINGLSRVLTLTRRAGEAGVQTATGQEAVPFVAGSALQSIFGSFGATLAAAGGIGAAARIYESAPVRSMLMQIGKTKPGSKEELAIAKRLLATIESQSQQPEE